MNIHDLIEDVYSQLIDEFKFGYEEADLWNIAENIANRIAHCLDVHFQSHALVSLLRPSITIYSSTGISTCCPSDTPFGLSLGPD